MKQQWEPGTKWMVHSGNLLVLAIVLWIGAYIGLRKDNPWATFSGPDIVIEAPRWMPLKIGEIFRLLVPLDFSITGKRTQIMTENRFHIGSAAEF